ncbi:hypothetical protein AB0M64_18335 [Streptomyces sp. NPDC051771]|uniref:hypothetical protein n=1 Tax=Streptomyces sp. NPDC051771 TaxID=3154847 RepID=UPI00342E3E1E
MTASPYPVLPDERRAPSRTGKPRPWWAGRHAPRSSDGHDSGRSPMAAALLAHRTGDGVGVSSAGTGPTSPPC